MNIAILGGLGFIGTNLYKSLAQNKKNKILVVDNLQIKQNYKYFNKKIIINNLSQKKQLIKILKNYEIVINLSAQSGVLQSMENPLFSIKNNILTYSNIIEALKNTKCKVFINASTAGAIYGESKKQCKENDPTNPKSIYGLTKQFNEMYSNIFEKNIKFKVIHLRFANVFGEYSFHKKSLIHTSIKNSLIGKEIKIFGDGSQIRNFIYVKDLVKILEKSFKLPSGIYNVSSLKSFSVNQFLKILKSIYPSSKIKYTSFNVGELKEVKISNHKVMKKLRISKKFFTDFRSAIIKTSNWYRKNLKNSVKYNPKIS